MTSISNKVWCSPAYFIAFGFGSGLSPIAPGTCGTLAAIPLYLILSSQAWGIYFVFTVMAFVLGVVVSDTVSKDLGVHDYGGIVWDEVVGYLLTMFMVPKGALALVLGFLLFRLFDVWKPQPIGWVDQRVHGGFGIMIDDVLAAVPAWLILQALAYYKLIG
jgi:phosphatidylglycerophosphatase A